MYDEIERTKHSEYRTDLLKLLEKDITVTFFFRTGKYHTITLQGHQYPLNKEFVSLNQLAFAHELLYARAEDKHAYYCMCSINAINPERIEYLIKRVLLALKNVYGWCVECS